MVVANAPPEKAGPDDGLRLTERKGANDFAWRETQGGDNGRSHRVLTDLAPRA